MNTRQVCIAIGAVALLLAAQARAADLAPPADGWASWEVPAVEDARDQCCWHGMKPGNAARTACNLDDQRGNLGNRDEARTDALRVYARMKSNKVEKLLVLSASCPVESTSSVKDLGLVPADTSARWLAALDRRRDPVTSRSSDNIIAAIAMHPGDFAFSEVASVARGDEGKDDREVALFWLAVARGLPGAEVVTQLMFNDRDSQIREHAAFAITESRSPRITADLIKLGNTDKVGDVRGQAWFWLAQTAAPESEQAIGAAVRKDSDDDVREKAIFALSQLPDERGTKALISVAEDKSLSAEQRKRALFWLAQSESSGAAVYLEKVLAGNLSR